MSINIKREQMRAEKEAEETPDIFRDRIRYIEASLAELVNEASKHHTELIARIEFATSTEATRAGTMAEKIIQVQKDIQELELMIYGAPKYLMPGLARQIQEIDEALKAIQAAEIAKTNQIKGIKMAMIFIGAASALSPASDFFQWITGI